MISCFGVAVRRVDPIDFETIVYVANKDGNLLSISPEFTRLI